MSRIVLVALLLLAGCSSVPPLPDEHRFVVSARRTEGERPEAIVRVEALWDAGFPNAQALRGEVSLVEGVVQLDVNGWTQTGEKGAIEARVGVRPGGSFRFALLHLGHRDEYTIAVPVSGAPAIEPPRGEFSSVR